MIETIVYLGSNIPDKTPAAVRVFANALALRDYGYDIKIVSNDVDYQEKFNIIEGIDTWHLRYPRSTKEWLASLIDVKQYTTIIDKIENVKAVIAYGISSIAFLRLRKYCKSKEIKLICETTEWQSWENLGHLGFFARIVRLADINTSMYFAYKKCDAIIVSSHYFADHFKKYLPVLSLPTLQCHRLEIDEIQVCNHPRKFIYAGGMGYQKDMLCEIIHAFSEIRNRDFIFNILGISKDQYLERFADDASIIDRINSKNERIIFWGEVSHSVVLNELSKSDFSLIIRQSTRRNNVGFPTKFGESINCGTPVIVSDFSDVMYYTKKYGVGLVTNENSIKESILKAIKMDDISLEEMRRRCKNCMAFYYKGNIGRIGGFVDSVFNNSFNK